MEDFKIRYRETYPGGSSSGSHIFSQEEIESFFKHFEKKNHCIIPHQDFMMKLVTKEPLTPEEEEKIKETVGSKLFKDFIEYINAYRTSKYQHELRPGCFKVAKRLRDIANQIIQKPRNHSQIGRLLDSTEKIEIPKADAPISIKIENIISGVIERNHQNHQEQEYENFASKPVWKKIDNFEIKYNSERQKILFGSCEQDWYIIVDGAQPRTIQKEFMPSKGKKGYILELETGDTYVIYVTGYEGGNILKYDFVPQELPIQVS